MIPVVRRASDMPNVMRGSGSAAADERRHAETLYRGGANKNENFEYRVYRQQEVREALERVFAGKCAYCETAIGPGAEADIEHWRPKGVVKQLDGTRTRPGYYWLAAQWDNLLLSCLRCNRPRRYRIEKSEETDEEWERLGKGELFPLDNPNDIATEPGAEANEKPLLLDPCRQKVDGYLQVVVDAADMERRGILQPQYRSGRRRKRAETSIVVFGLNRQVLVDARRRHLLELVDHLDQLNDALTLHANAADDATRTTSGKMIGREVHAILERLARDAEYQLMVRAVVKQYLAINPQLTRVLARMLDRK